MLISVVMCTRNRAEQLRRVLTSVAEMCVPPGLLWEFLLVDNGSTDHTAAVADSFKGQIPIRYIFEEKAGLSHARNRGVSVARGDYICWSDDDVLIDAHWIEAYADAFNRHPEAVVFGGVIEPVTEVPLPGWWQENKEVLASVLASRDFGDAEMALSIDGDHLPFGANFAIRAAEQREHLYDPSLGVSPQHKRLGEETAVLRAIILSGGSGVWVPRSRVRHIIPASRLTKDYVGVYYRSVGETWAYLVALGKDNFIGDVELPRNLWLKCLRHGLGHKFKTAVGDRSGALWHWLQLNYYLGASNYQRLAARHQS